MSEVPDEWRDDLHTNIIEPCEWLDFCCSPERPKVAAADYAETARARQCLGRDDGREPEDGGPPYPGPAQGAG